MQTAARDHVEGRVNFIQSNQTGIHADADAPLVRQAQGGGDVGRKGRQGRLSRKFDEGRQIVSSFAMTADVRDQRVVSLGAQSLGVALRKRLRFRNAGRCCAPNRSARRHGVWSRDSAS